METDLGQKRRRTWARLQKQLEFYAPKGLRKFIENRNEDVEDIEDYEAMVEEHLSIAKQVAAISYLPQLKVSQNPSPNPSQRRYQRPFQRRLHLVYFVIGMQISSKKQRNKIRKRINWGDTCKAWNEAHPNDSMTPKVLKATFYRAVREEDLQREFKKEMDIWVDEALWIGWLSQVIEGEDLIEKWASLFMLREMIYGVMGKPLDDKQQEIEIEAINSPHKAQERLGETIRKGVAFVNNLDFNELKDLSDAEIREIVKSQLEEKKDEGKHPAKKQT
jgi:hypothetical protein